MEKHVAVSVLGKDRPGIVSAITKALYETGCNIEDSSMTLLRSEFAMILLVSLPAKTTAKELQKKLGQAGKKLGLSILLRPISVQEDKNEKPAGKPFVVGVYGADKPGIVYKLSKYLSTRKINITDVQTNISRATSGPVYIMFLEVDVPPAMNVKTMQEELEEIAGALNVHINIHQAESPAL